MSWYCETKNGQIICHCHELNNLRVRQAFSTKTSGNMALHTGDDPKAVIDRRENFLNVLGFHLRQLVAGEQTHGINVYVVTKQAAGSGAFRLDTMIPETDALITRDTGVVLSTYTADCLPIFIYDPSTPAVGLVHAGWRGSLQGILAKTLEKMNMFFRTTPSRCKIAIGPGICAKCFTVAADVANQFNDVFPGAVHHCNSNYQVDLVEFNKWILDGFGVPAEHVITSQWCTVCSADRFYSYRAHRGTIGRMMGIIGLLEET